MKLHLRTRTRLPLSLPALLDKDAGFYFFCHNAGEVAVL